MLPGFVLSLSSSMSFLASATDSTRPVDCFSNLMRLWTSAKFCLSCGVGENYVIAFLVVDLGVIMFALSLAKLVDPGDSLCMIDPIF